ncbi:hypothetical protein OIU34_37025 [Pararhizobium sp. BT-229]|uniref:hypothetical protein n=1 Tax=Pararhizobium sp. BT-229 TaxID=2986923 RepID=UPI0021F75F53|nr:hypothetical protein [Pararhizobium sp. BT-229]MCV9967438.1 hypothetical protein [Pararhizobium sp. BT-229]
MARRLRFIDQEGEVAREYFDALEADDVHKARSTAFHNCRTCSTTIKLMFEEAGDIRLTLGAGKRERTRRMTDGSNQSAAPFAYERFWRRDGCGEGACFGLERGRSGYWCKEHLPADYWNERSTPQNKRAGWLRSRHIP